MRQKRRDMTTQIVSKNSDIICKRLFSLECMKNANTVCTFLSAFKEPDTIPIVKKLLSESRRVAVPISNTDTLTLTLSYIEGCEDLKKGPYGIYEPSVIREAEADDIDVALVPGLAFGRDGSRMGFGKGYYDRLLANGKFIKIGLCYDFQLLDAVPSEAHDVPMDYIITEKETVKVR